jgi:hypothetical protein
MSSLPLLPVADKVKGHWIGIASTEQTIPIVSQASKRSSNSQGRGVVVEVTDKRVRRACERCRTKKTKVVLSLPVAVFNFGICLTL